MQARTSGIDSGAYSDLNRLGQYKVGGDSEANIQKAAQEFESLFINQMLKAMRAGNEVFAEGNFLNSSESKTYQDMHDQQLSVTLAKEGGIGLADVLVRQMSKLKERASRPNPFAQEGAAGVPPAVTASQMNSPSAWPSSPQAALNSRLPAAGEAARDDSRLLNQRRLALPGRGSERLQVAMDAAQPPQLAARDWVPARSYAAPAERPLQTQGGQVLNFDTPADFVASLMPMAEQAAAKIGVDPRYLVAQAALETGWGKSIIKQGGESSHNLFGIKSHGWKGASASVMTTEYHNGQAIKERASFRSYDSLAQSFDDYVTFLQSNGRYRTALQQTANPEQFMRELQRAGYATDPQYARKVNQIARQLDTYQRVADASRPTAQQRT